LAWTGVNDVYELPKVNGLKSVEVTRMQVTEWRVNPAYKLQVAFFLLYVVFFFFFWLSFL